MDKNDPKTTEQPGEEISVADVKSMINLPETASDIEVITALVNLISNLQEKYEMALTSAQEMEGQIANSDLDRFSDIVGTNREFWLNQILSNRDATIQTLESLAARTAGQTPADPSKSDDTQKLRLINRRQPPTTDPAGSETAFTPEQVAAATAIRNRAHDIVKTEGVPFIIAFERAAGEFAKPTT